MSIAHDREMARRRGEVDPIRLRRIQRLQGEVDEAQSALERAVSEALANGEPLNELARQTGIAKTTLIRWTRR